MAETPEQKYNRIAAAVRQTILNEFPNPNRIGCPGSEKLREVAARRTIVEDDHWQHITHCSPCYAEYLDVKEQNRRAGRRARALGLIGGTALLIVLTGVVGYQYIGKARTEQPIVAGVFESATLNLKESSGTRGDQKAPQRDTPVLPARRLNLRVILPFGSEAGRYQVEFMDKNGRVFMRAESLATLSAGETSFTLHLDLTGAVVGTYTIGLRQDSFDWVRYQLQIR